MSTKIQTVVFDTKPYDREPLQRAAAGLDIEWRFMECRLSAETAAAAHGAQAVCIFVNDHADRPCLEALAKLGVKHVALRCAGFNSVDLPAAKELGVSVTRVPAYSPYAVAEHAGPPGGGHYYLYDGPLLVDVASFARGESVRLAGAAARPRLAVSAWCSRSSR